MRGLPYIFPRKGSRFWQMEYWLGGKRKRESTGCERPKEANDVLRRKIGELMQELDRQDGGASAAAPTPPPGLLVSDLYAAVEQDYDRNKKDVVNLRCRWKNHLAAEFGAMPIASVTIDHVNAYISKRIQEMAKNATINRELAILKRSYLLGRKNGRLKFGEWPYIGMLSEKDNVRTGFVEDAQYVELQRATGEIGLWLRAIFELGFCYAWRKSELLRLRVSQIDMLNRQIVLHPGTTKNKDGRIVEMTPEIYEMLALLIAGKGKEDFVFTRTLRDGRIKRVKGFRKAWIAATIAAGCPGQLFHDLRRSGVRNMIDDGVPDDTAMKISGHRTRAVFSRYNIVNRENIRKAVQKIEAGNIRRRKKALYEQTHLAFGDPEQPPKKPTVGIKRTDDARKIQ